MKVRAIQDVNGFFQALDECEGRVELITEDHDVLNLASKLTQFIGLTRVFSNPDYTSYEIVCYHAEDYDKLKKYLVPADANCGFYQGKKGCHTHRLLFPNKAFLRAWHPFLILYSQFPQPAANRATAATDAASINTARKLLHLTTPKPHSHPLLPQR